MGKIKQKQQEKASKEFALTSYELNFLKAMAANRNAAYNQYQTAIQAFLSYLAGTKWGFTKGDLLEFEMDAEKELVMVTIKEKSID